jgi:hypothetical protein
MICLWHITDEKCVKDLIERSSVYSVRLNSLLSKLLVGITHRQDADENA